jgi:hypothetical protein
MHQAVTSHLLSQRWQQLLILQQLHNDSIAKPKASARHIFAAKGAEQLVISASTADGAQLPGTVKAFKHNACRKQ